jgi:glycosyltransferase involved in cell wall biosynthesis
VQTDKGVFDLLHAYESLTSDHRRRAALVYAGDGPDLERLLQQSKRDGLSDAVLLLGRVSHRALPGIIRACDVTVTPTRPEFPEGRCMVVLESLALGVPVVAPRFGPFPFAVEHGRNGLLYEPGNVEALRKCLEVIVEGTETRRQLKGGAVASATSFMIAPTGFANAVDMAFRDRAFTGNSGSQ